MNDPELSVVLTVVDGDDALRRCLGALLSQEDAPRLEIVIPIDSTMSSRPWTVDLRDAHDRPPVRWLDLGTVPTMRPPTSAAGQHELIDRRRAAGLAAARGQVIAMVEDRAVPRRTWTATAIRLHRELPHLVIGGAIENQRDAMLNWAVYYCDFGRYQLPFPAGVRRYVSDVNVTYKRTALDRTRDLWRDRYHEPVVHWALEQAGEQLFLSPALVVDQSRDNVTLAGLIRERVAWGRLFGAMRVQQTTRLGRLVRTAGVPLVPPLLFGRFLRDRIVRRANLVPVARCAPAVALLMLAWTAGEAIGTLTARSA
jgi:hypothetical protein